MTVSGESVRDMLDKIHTPVQDTRDIDALAGDRIDHHMLFDIERAVSV
jgi:hypothetical protein